ncbi:MAG TPA: hypothetical protein PLW86_02020 [Rhodocyclaceae bacterium]|nr:hypothetical protein [Rhodocyclaceae bacterium]
MKTLLTILVLTLASSTALAHDEATLDKVQAPNGGQLRMAGMYHFELVVTKEAAAGKEQPVAVYLTDHADKKISAAGASGTATFLAGGQKTTIKLSPAGGNKLEGRGSYSATPDMKVVVSISFADKTTEQARFAPLAGKTRDKH